jgi:hypothetical protein
MSTVILAAGTAAANSTDVVVAAGTPATIFLTAAVSGPVPSEASCDIQIKETVGATYHTIGKLTGSNPIQVIDAPGTYRVSRLLSTASVGVSQG